jgi:hypothetical protein
VNQELDRLPPDVHLSTGRIVLDGFSTREEAKQKLLALIMAMGNDTPMVVSICRARYSRQQYSSTLLPTS